MTAKKIVQKISLTEWAALHYGTNVPHTNTLRKWAREGLIQPKPVKTGRIYMVLPDAQYVPPQGAK